MKIHKPTEKNKKRYDSIVILYSEGWVSSEIFEKLRISEPSYWRILREGGGMPVWARIDHWKNKKLHQKEKAGLEPAE